MHEFASMVYYLWFGGHLRGTQTVHAMVIKMLWSCLLYSYYLYYWQEIIIIIFEQMFISMHIVIRCWWQIYGNCMCWCLVLWNGFDSHYQQSTWLERIIMHQSIVMYDWLYMFVSLVRVRSLRLLAVSVANYCLFII